MSSGTVIAQFQFDLPHPLNAAVQFAMRVSVDDFDDSPFFQHVDAILNPQNIGIQERIFPVNSAVNVGAGE